MKVVALISGGKDSCYNIMQCMSAGHEVVALANLKPCADTEIDSYMYQSVGFEAIELIAEAIGLPLFRKDISGASKNLNMNYSPTENDEVEDLFKLLQGVKDQLPIEAVSVGAILSDYQRTRVENVCTRLNLVSLAYLWRRNQNELLEEMIKNEIDAIIVKVAALGLEPSRHLGRSLRLVEPHLVAMQGKYGLNVCGEGGEYETLVLDCPLYGSRLIVEESEVILHSKDPIAPVGFLKLNKIKLEPKLPQLTLNDRLSTVKVKDSNEYIVDCLGDVVDNLNDTLDCSYTGTKSKLFEQMLSCSISNDGWLWISGLCGNSGNCEVALKNALEKLKFNLAAYGHQLEDVTSVVMFISDMSTFAELNKLYVDVLKHINPPSRACVEVPLPANTPVILDVLSWKGSRNDDKGDTVLERRTMHVQSISHWAPANIGPYSQAVRIGDIIHIAGQIGLVPGSMELAQSEITSQCQLAIRHIERIISAMETNANLRHVVQAICYVNDKKLIDVARKYWEMNTNNAIVNYVVVTALPKNSLVEWHVWAHKHNSSFEYKETRKCINGCSILTYRRCNYDINVSAIVSHMDCSHDLKVELSVDLYREFFYYIMQKLQSGLENVETSISNLKIFFSIQKNINITDILTVLNELKEKYALVYLLVPVVNLSSEHTVLSISGIQLP